MTHVNIETKIHGIRQRIGQEHNGEIIPVRELAQCPFLQNIYGGGAIIHPPGTKNTNTKWKPYMPSKTTNR